MGFSLFDWVQRIDCIDLVHLRGIDLSVLVVVEILQLWPQLVGSQCMDMLPFVNHDPCFGSNSLRTMTWNSISPFRIMWYWLTESWIVVLVWWDNWTWESAYFEHFVERSWHVRNSREIMKVSVLCCIYVRSAYSFVYGLLLRLSQPTAFHNVMDCVRWFNWRKRDLYVVKYVYQHLI